MSDNFQQSLIDKPPKNKKESQKKTQKIRKKKKNIIKQIYELLEKKSQEETLSNLTNNVTLKEIENYFNCVAFSPDRSTIAVSHQILLQNSEISKFKMKSSFSKNIKNQLPRYFQSRWIYTCQFIKRHNYQSLKPLNSSRNRRSQGTSKERQLLYYQS